MCVLLSEKVTGTSRNPLKSGKGQANLVWHSRYMSMTTKFVTNKTPCDLSHWASSLLPESRFTFIVWEFTNEVSPSQARAVLSIMPSDLHRPMYQLKQIRSLNYLPSEIIHSMFPDPWVSCAAKFASELSCATRAVSHQSLSPEEPISCSFRRKKISNRSRKR